MPYYYEKQVHNPVIACSVFMEETFEILHEG